jgi:hypothetical protein
MCDDKTSSCGNNQGGCGGHHGCSGGWGHKSLLRVLLALLLLGFVFCAGVKVGMLKAYFGFGGWGHYRGLPVMMYGNGDAGYGPGMMQTWTKEVTSTKK